VHNTCGNGEAQTVRAPLPYRRTPGIIRLMGKLESLLTQRASAVACFVVLCVVQGCEPGSSKPPAPTELDASAEDAGDAALDAALPDASSEDASPDAADGGDPNPDAGGDPVSQMLAARVVQLQLTGDPATPRGIQQIKPADNALVRLGQLLFFSQSIAGGFDSSCGTCHLADLGGSDGLSISVGVAPNYRMTVGPGRVVDNARDRDPQADGGPNMHRNSLTTFNAALHDRALLMDGRVFVLDEAFIAGGHGQNIRTPETGNNSDTSDADGLLQVMSKFPTVNDNEMRGFLYSDIPTPFGYRDRLLARMRGTADAQYMSPNAAQNWLSRFRAAFARPAASAQELITMVNVQRALAAFISATTFVDTPWRSYVNGSLDAIDAEAKRGALLFLMPKDQGGLGCVTCHAGDRFTDESFVNAGFPQIGRGFRSATRRDPGRWFVTRRQEDMFAFRVPGLLNVALTAPYGHAGTFATLEQVIRYHANPRAAVDTFDFTLQHLDQFRSSGVTYAHAEPHTREVIAHDSFATTEDQLPGRSLTDSEVQQLVAFLNSLTDPCLTDSSCRNQWTPDAALDPDGNMLVRDRTNSPAPDVVAETPSEYPTSLPLVFPSVTVRSTFSDTLGCADGLTTAVNAGTSAFVSRTGNSAFGLNDAHGFSYATWANTDGTAQTEPGGAFLEAVMIAGGVTATYLDDDCWPDLAFAGGDSSGLVFYLKRPAQAGYAVADLLGDAQRATLGTRFSGFAVADLNGDYRRELVLGNVHQGEVPLLASNDSGGLQQIGALPTSRNTFGISFGMLGSTGYPDMYLAHWSFSGTPGTAPALFQNQAGVAMRPYDGPGGTSTAILDQTFNFTPLFADLTADGRQDLVIASDFNSSQALQNVDGVAFSIVTDRNVLSDENGMGSALGDFDGDGDLDWFVTSVFDPSGMAAANWGVTGNRLYRNISVNGSLIFEDITESAGVRDGAWGWGACAADFNNDGHLDIFHGNGFGYIPDGLLPPDEAHIRDDYNRATAQYFQSKPPRLFINAGNGTFVEEAAAWQVDVPSEGRGLVCFDHDRDGDIDIALLDHSVGLQFFENQTGHGVARRFVNVRVVGSSPNTEALGAEVIVVANVDAAGTSESLLRVAAANSNFNSQNLPDLHFGLGQATVIDSLTVRWPDDATPLTCTNVNVNQFLVFDQRNKVCP